MGRVSSSGKLLAKIEDVRMLVNLMLRIKLAHLSINTLFWIWGSTAVFFSCGSWVLVEGLFLEMEFWRSAYK